MKRRRASRAPIIAGTAVFAVLTAASVAALAMCITILRRWER